MGRNITIETTIPDAMTWSFTSYNATDEGTIFTDPAVWDSELQKVLGRL